MGHTGAVGNNPTGPIRGVAAIELRKWQRDDTASVLEAFSSADMRNQSSFPITSTTEAAAWIGQVLASWDAGKAYCWAIARESGEPVGAVTVSALDRVHDIGWISFWTSEAARGAGLASTGTRMLADWCFKELGLFRLELGHRTNNPASCKVARRAGFLVEGLERAKLSYGGERFDVELHAKLATDPH